MTLLQKKGVQDEHIRFYHAGINDVGGEGDSTIKVANKDDLLDTTKAWRDVRFIVTTATLTVAFNPRLAFYTVWLFVSFAQKRKFLTSEANKIMQLVARIPRGSVDEQEKQLVDHRIWTLFDGDFPCLKDPPKQVDQNSLSVLKRKYKDASFETQQEQLRGIEARLACHGEGGAGPHRRYDAQLQAMRAAAALYRDSHIGSQVAF